MFAGIYLIFSWYDGKSYVFQIEKTGEYSPFQRKSAGNLAFISLDTMLIVYGRDYLLIIVCTTEVEFCLN